MKKTTKLIAIVCVIAMMAALFAGCGSKTKGYTANNTEFVIGLSGPLTGGAAIYGQAVANSAQMAVDEINAAGGLNGTTFKVIAVDDKHDASMIATNYATLYEGGMQVSLGTVTSAPGLEFKTYSHEDNVFFLTPSATTDSIPEFDNGYQMCFADSNQGAGAALYVNEVCAGQTIGLFYKSDDPYSVGIYNKFMEKVDPSITVIETSFNDSTATDFSTQIDTLKDCSFIFMPIYYQPASLFATQAVGVIADDAVYYGCDGLDGIDSMPGFDITAVPQEISMLSHFNSTATEGPAADYIAKYVDKYGAETLNQFGASAYDCVYAIYNAMKEISDADSKAISVTMSASDLSNLLKAKFQGGFTFSGITGENITWDQGGYVNKAAIKYIIKEAN